jgi:peptidoglycan/LPS O-acetylase OafA/YrhL
VRPELPFLAAGAVAVIGGAIREKKWPENTARATIGTIVLVVVASATTNSKAAPLVHAIGLLLLLTSVMAAVRATQKGKK